jgi:uncharacterized protein
MNPLTRNQGTSKKHWLLIVLLLIATAMIVSYPLVINSCAFYPDTGDLLPVASLPADVEEIYVSTEDGERLQCYWIARPRSDRVLLYFHGNAGNIGQRLSELRALADLGLNVLGVGYRGYGKSSGRPSENGIYADGRAALRFVTEQKGFAPERVLLLGRSIGSTVAVEIAREQPLGAVILVTPLTSGEDMVRASGLRALARFIGDRFNNLRKIDELRAPLLILHGTEDDITPFWMGLKLYGRAPEPKHFVTLEDRGHNDIGRAGHNAYWDAIAAFLLEYGVAQTDK